MSGATAGKMGRLASVESKAVYKSLCYRRIMCNAFCSYDVFLLEEPASASGKGIVQ
jgi:hypothetical protein